VPDLGAPALRALHRFMSTMHVLRERSEQNTSVAELIKEALAETGYLEALEAERTIEAQGRIENLEELVNVAAEYDAAEESGGGLAAFLQQVQLLSDADERSDEEHLVTLMTLHNAKGLEYGIVFIIGCEEGVFPHSRALDEGGLEEERRLCYVGITRAQRDLYLTWALTRGVFGTRTYGMPSRFLGEIPKELTDREDDAGPGVGPRPRATSWASAVGSGPPPVAFSLGDDVAHPSFGEGVVTGLEPGGIVVVRFAKDRSERKLVADLAPIVKR
jgi:DNA helicase-2/ATP-dependent DNA helicase PcrA